MQIDSYQAIDRQINQPYSQTNRTNQSSARSYNQNIPKQQTYSPPLSQRNVIYNQDFQKQFSNENLSIRSEQIGKSLHRNYNSQNQDSFQNESIELKKQIYKMQGEKIKYQSQIIQLQRQNSDYQSSLQELSQRLKQLKVQNQDLKDELNAKEQAERRQNYQQQINYPQENFQQIPNNQSATNKTFERSNVTVPGIKQTNQEYGKNPSVQNANSQNSFKYIKSQGQLDLSPIVDMMNEQNFEPPVIYIDFSYVFPEQTSQFAQMFSLLES